MYYSEVAKMVINSDLSMTVDIMIIFLCISVCVCFTGEIGKAPAAVSDTLPVPETPDVPVSDEEEEEDMEGMRERLQALRS